MRQIIGVANATVCAKQAQRFIFNWRYNFFAVGIKIDIAALNGAAGHTSVGLLAAAAGVERANVVAAHLKSFTGFGIGKLSAAKVAHWQAADHILKIGHAHCANGSIKACDHRVS